MKIIPFGIIISNVMIGSACITKGIVETSQFGLIGFANLLLATIVWLHERGRENVE